MYTKLGAIFIRTRSGIIRSLRRHVRCGAWAASEPRRSPGARFLREVESMVGSSRCCRARGRKGKRRRPTSRAATRSPEGPGP